MDELLEMTPKSPMRLAWRAFRRHGPGRQGLALLVLLYLMTIFAGFIAPYDSDNVARKAQWAPPSSFHMRDAGNFSWRPFIYAFKMKRDPDTFSLVVDGDMTQKCYLRFFVEGDSYELFGIFNCRRHLFGIDPPARPGKPKDPYFSRVYLMGADGSGRDIFSRICFGSRISMTIGLVGVAVVLVIGLSVGGASGYFGGRVDTALQRLCEMVMLLPGFYLLLMLRFMFPQDMDSVQVYFAVIFIMALVGWAGFSRVVRGMVLSIRSQDYLMAARALGISHARTIRKHVIPNTLGYVVVAMTLAVPGYILGESALSVLGLGIEEPTPSWGNMLHTAMDLSELRQHPWILWPGAFIFLAVMGFNLVGDALRDAVDPRAQSIQ